MTNPSNATPIAAFPIRNGFRARARDGDVPFELSAEALRIEQSWVAYRSSWMVGESDCSW
jgi:hypothetical protein